MIYWWQMCKRCGQGRLLIETDDGSGELLLRCEECERVWRDPRAVDHTESAEDGIDLYSSPAHLDEITRRGWAMYAVHHADR